jgi:trimeric autotransporter adhesin
VLTNSSLGPQITLPTGSGSGTMVIADFDGDGKPDLAVNCGSDHTIYIYRNISTNGTLAASSFAPPVVLQLGTGCEYDMVAADVSGDGKPDLLFLDMNSSVVVVLQNFCTPGSITTNSFGPRVNLAVGSGPKGVAVRDLDGDGKPEIVTANQDSGTISVLRNFGAPGNLTTNSFASALTFATGSGPQNVMLADMDGDGKPDAVTVNLNSTAGAISVLRNLSTQGNIAFAPKVDFSGPTYSYNLMIGDMDGDGKLDVVSVSFATGQSVSVYRNTSTPGSFSTSSLAPRVDFALGGWGNGMTLGDVDGDGKPDVAAVTQGSSKLSLFRNLSTPGSFSSSSLAARLNFTSGSNPYGVAIGDLDGDGRPDIVFANNGSATVSIYQNVVPVRPFIIAQPAGSTNRLNTTTTFSVIASGSPVLRYQWKFNGTNVDGATNSWLTFTNLHLSQSGNYAVLVTNVYGSILSSNATLVINPLLYFVWSQIPSPRFANAPFAVVIQAQNLTNGIATNFTDSVVLRSTNGVAVSPAVSGNFIQGVWTGAVTVAQTVTNLVLQASDSFGESGLANPINILSLPALTTVPSGSTLYIFWPVNPPGFVLETTARLSPADWVPVTTPPFPIGNQNLLPIQMSGTNAFYRLRFNSP